jgi:XTP/dITP diphosphohydrolase
MITNLCSGTYVYNLGTVFAYGSTTMTTKIVLASNNAGKLNEFNALFADQRLEVVPQKEFSIPDAIEDGLSFVENAIIKARHAATLSGLPAIADDSGLEVDYLNGAPGIYSARFSGEEATDATNNQKLLKLLGDIPTSQRHARFQCVLVYMRHANDPTPVICQGTWEGIISREQHGEMGFGYDPLFFVPEHNCSSAELPREIKNNISHRAQAMKLLMAKLTG